MFGLASGLTFLKEKSSVLWKRAESNITSRFSLYGTVTLAHPDAPRSACASPPSVTWFRMHPHECMCLHITTHTHVHQHIRKHPHVHTTHTPLSDLIVLLKGPVCRGLLGVYHQAARLFVQVCIL